MKSLLKTSKILVCVGSGGVGKTSVSASLGYLAASDGLKVHVLTIDPSQRLKTTLGFKPGELSTVCPTPGLSGELSASIVDPKKTFDEFLARASGQAKAHKLLNNKLYQQLSTTLSGSQEFTALEKLYSLHESGQYDLIILDTPPAKHAIDFLEAPQKLAALFHDSVAKWFRDPEGQKQGFLKSILQQGTKQVLRGLEAITGSDFMRELSDFFQNIESFQSQLEDRVNAVHRLLVHEQTHFALVTSFDEAKLIEAEEFARSIRRSGYKLSAVLINRAYPYWYFEPFQPESAAVNELYQTMKTYFAARDALFQKFASQMASTGVVARLPELRNEISNLDGVAKLAHDLERGAE